MAHGTYIEFKYDTYMPNTHNINSNTNYITKSHFPTYNTETFQIQTQNATIHLRTSNMNATTKIYKFFSTIQNIYKSLSKTKTIHRKHTQLPPPLASINRQMTLIRQKMLKNPHNWKLQLHYKSLHNRFTKLQRKLNIQIWRRHMSKLSTLHASKRINTFWKYSIKN